jgi:23S rRNA pseudouridine1911/1915/1917 synthase
MQSQIFSIVFEDSELLVIEKLVPFLSQKGDEGDAEGLYEFISRQRNETILPVHRLDRDVLGLMIFAKTKSAADAISDQFRSRSVRKGYEAYVKGRVFKDSDTLVHYLKKNPKNNYVTVFPNPTEGAKKAELSYVVLERADKRTRLFIWLKTGRSHQIRAQLAKIGHPIIGDSKYSKEKMDPNESPSIQLRSCYLQVSHPISKERLTWTLLDAELQTRLESELNEKSL